jgi:hypothetical protein
MVTGPLLVGLVVVRYDRTAAPISSIMARSRSRFRRSAQSTVPFGPRFCVEKLFPSRRTATYLTAAILLVLGALLTAASDTIPALTVPGDGSMSQMDQMSP